MNFQAVKKACGDCRYPCDASAGVDPWIRADRRPLIQKGRDEILDQVALLQKEREDPQLYWCPHSMEDVARYVDRIIVVNDGKILF